MMILVFWGAAASGAEKVSALFIYWRGKTECAAGLTDGLREAGYDMAVSEFDAAQDPQALDRFLDTLDPASFRFIYTFGTTASLRTAQKVKTTPILFGIVTNPVKSGLIRSWESPGGNVTGVSHAVPYSDQVTLIRELGAFRKIGIIYNSKEDNSRIAVEALTTLFDGTGVNVIGQPVASAESVESATIALLSQKPDLVYLPSDSFIQSQAAAIIPLINAAKVPTYGALEKMVEQGALIGIVSDYYTVGKKLAENAVQILKGQPPSEVPSRMLPLADHAIYINTETLEAIGAKIPVWIMNMSKLKQ